VTFHGPFPEQLAVSILSPSRRTDRVLLHGVSWATYEALLADMEDRAIRLTYDQGELEIMAPSDEHERIKTLIGRLVEAMTEVLEIPIRSAGSTTLRRELKRRGLEPDECYYVAHESIMRGRDTMDLDVDPPPDLAIEVNINRSCLDRFGIYAAIGIPEIWRLEDGKIQAYALTDAQYTAVDNSPSFPFLPLAELSRILRQRNDTDETTWIRSFRRWAATLR
jgi:Uma2 family endonuclease